MKAGSFRYCENGRQQAYSEYQEKSMKHYESEMRDLVAKIKGSSLKEPDKKLAFQELTKIITKEL